MRNNIKINTDLENKDTCKDQPYGWIKLKQGVLTIISNNCLFI